MGRKQERELKQAMDKVNMGDMVKAVEQSDFRLLTIVGFLNKLAMLTLDDNPFLSISKVLEMDLKNEELVQLTATHIIYHDVENTDEDLQSYPVVARINGKDETGKLSVEYADTAYGNSLTHYRVVQDSGAIFVTVFCGDKTILVTDGQWFTA